MSFATAVLQKMLHDARMQPPPPDDDTDVLFLVGGGNGPPLASHRAHRLVLATVSPVFHDWFRADAASGPSASPGVHVGHIERRRSPREAGVLTVRLGDFPPPVVAAALDVIYGGPFVDADDWTLAGQCWDFAVRFEIPHLVEIARKHALRKLDQANALHLLGFALSVNDERAIDQVADYIGLDENFASIVQAPGFVDVEGPLLDAIVRPRAGTLIPGQNTTVEKVWFDALMAWLRVPDENVSPSDQNGGGAESASATSRFSGTQPNRLAPPKRYPRLRHVDHLLTLVDFNRMLTDELAIIAEDVTACHAATFPHCLIPILAGRALFLGREQTKHVKEISELGNAFESAVFAKNEAERGRRILEVRLEQTRQEVTTLKEALREKHRKERSPPAELLLDRRSDDSPGRENRESGVVATRLARPRPFYEPEHTELPLITAPPLPQGEGELQPVFERIETLNANQVISGPVPRTFQQERRRELRHLGHTPANPTSNFKHANLPRQRNHDHAHDIHAVDNTSHVAPRLGRSSDQWALPDGSISPLTRENTISPDHTPRRDDSPSENGRQVTHSDEELRRPARRGRGPALHSPSSNVRAMGARNSSLPNIHHRQGLPQHMRVRRRVPREAYDGVQVPTRPPPVPRLHLSPQRVA